MLRRKWMRRGGARPPAPTGSAAPAAADSLKPGPRFAVGTFAGDMDATALCRLLERRGVSAALAERVSRRVALRLQAAKSGPEAMEWLAEAVAEALKPVTTRGAPGDSGELDLREIERLLAAFMGELSKLDEVLEVLTAHVDRMRASSQVAEGDTLH